MKRGARGPGRDVESRQRIRRYRTGLYAERVAAFALRVRGYRILDRRFRTPVGEIDLVTLRSGRIGFVEVKRRPDRAQCIAAISPKTRERVRRAAGLWQARHVRYQDLDVGFDLVFVLPGRWPEFLKDAL